MQAAIMPMRVFVESNRVLNSIRLRRMELHTP